MFCQNVSKLWCHKVLMIECNSTSKKRICLMFSVISWANTSVLQISMSHQEPLQHQIYQQLEQWHLFHCIYLQIRYLHVLNLTGLLLEYMGCL